MKLCVAEKPSVAKELARILGANNRKDGYFEGNGYCISWTFGHLCTLKAPDDYTIDWKTWRKETLPMIPGRFGIKVMDNPSVVKQFNTIKKLSEECEEVINCGDAGIEGELIQRWVLSKAGCNKPMKRLWISSLTDESIKEGFKNLREGSDFDLLYAAGNARAIGDWLLGMNATRLYTLKYAQNRGVLSVGRVQTPTLALIVSRYHEIENFKPQTYWEIKTVYKEVTFSSTHGRYDSAEDAKEKLQSIAEHDFEVVSFTKKKGKESPPKLFDLTYLQVECNKKFNFSADETLKHIQKLYEQKYVTYPRVDTTFLPNDVYPKIAGILQKMTPYAQYTHGILQSKIPKSKKVFDDKKITDHHAIIPTGIIPHAGVPRDQKLIYDLISRHFIAAFSPDCIVSNTTVMGDVNTIEFKATGKMILEPGWRVLFPKKEGDSKSNTQLMPLFEKGERGPHEPDLQEKQTQPPKNYTEATLLRAMETAGKQVDDEELRSLMKENGIGRPSTRANIIETLFKRKYMVRMKKNLIPTQTGIQLIATIQNELLKSVELTGQWERKIRQVENGEYEVSKFLDEMKLMVATLVHEVKHENYRAISIEPDKDEKKKEEKGKSKTKVPKKSGAKSITELKCPKCNTGSLLKGNAAYGCSEFKAGCNFRLSFEYFGKKISEKQSIRLLEKGSSTAIKGFTIDGQKQDGKLEFDSEFQVILKKTEKKSKAPKEFTCPKCGKGKLLKGNSAYGCSEYNNGCRFVIPFAVLESSYGTKELSAGVLKKIVGN